jgi:hypothetical protein
MFIRIQIINISPISTVFFLGGGGGIIKIKIVNEISPVSVISQLVYLVQLVQFFFWGGGYN